jgi:hypothetical protein
MDQKHPRFSKCTTREWTYERAIVERARTAASAERDLLKSKAQERLMDFVELWNRTMDDGDTSARLEASTRLADFAGLRAPDDGLGDDPTPAAIARHHQERARIEDADA